MNWLLVTLCSLVISISTYSQSASRSTIADSTIFSGKEEHQLFLRILESENADLLGAAMISNRINNSGPGVGAAREKIDVFVERNESVKKGLDNAKTLKKFYSEIHNAFLGKYTDHPGFSEIFTSGNYNCATATFLYAYILEKSNVAYTIRETPTHVYIVAAPESHNVIFEATAPGASVISIDDKMKGEFLLHLQRQKLVSEDELNTGNKEEIFTRFFYRDKGITLKELVGLLYYNVAVEAAMKKDYQAAWRNFEKASLLYPSERHKYLSGVSLASILQSSAIQLDDKFPYFVRYASLDNSTNGKDVLIENFELVTKKYLLRDPDPAKQSTIYHYLAGAVKDSAVLQTIHRIHYYYSAYAMQIKGENDSCIYFVEKQLAINSNDLLAQELFLQSFTSRITGSSKFAQNMDTLDLYFKKYAFLRKNTKLQDFYLYSMANMMEQFEEKDLVKKGPAIIERLKGMLKENPNLSARSEQVILMPVIAMSMYYVQKGNYKASRDLLASFEPYLPRNEEIIRRMKHAEKYMKK